MQDLVYKEMKATAPPTKMQVNVSMNPRVGGSTLVLSFPGHMLKCP